MRVTNSLIAFLLSVVSLLACAPEDKCGGQLYYDPATTNCRRCPMNAMFKDGSCVCTKDKYVFENNMCVLMDGAVPDKPMDEDSGKAGGGGPSCSDYCDFAKSCVGENSLAAAALKDIVMGLHADDTDACTSACKKDVGGDGSMDPVVACITKGVDDAMCVDNPTQAGITGAFTLIGQCCGPNKDNMLCKSICATLKANSLVSAQVTYCD